ncbi:hypothetical protein FB107DRAFT_260174 [Schizophyllum commune]
MSVLRTFSTTVIALLLARQAAGQNAQCTDSQFDWSYNSIKQSPCDVLVNLGAVCNGGIFSVPSLSSGEQYVGPDPQFATDCRCNTVFYSMLAACSACQDAEYIGWTMYSANCSSVAIEEFPRDIPGGTRIPHWAYQDVVTNNTFDIQTAINDAYSNAPESTASAKPTFSTSKSSGHSTATGSGMESSGSSSASGGGSKTNVGAIAGGVVGGVVGLAAIIGLAFFFLRRRKQQRAKAPSSAYLAPPMSSATPPLPPSTPGAFSEKTEFVPPNAPPTPKLYDPSDPTTFPSSPAPTGTTYRPDSQYDTSVPYGATTLPYTNQYDGNNIVPYHQPQAQHYSGVPEV